MRPLSFRVVQTWGPDKARQATPVSEHATSAEASVEIDRLSSEMGRTSAPNDGIERVVVDADDHVVRRFGKGLSKVSRLTR